MDWKSLLGHRIVKLTSIGTFAVGAFLVQPYRPMIFMGHSMAPTYADRELALMTTDVQHLTKGDVVVVKANGGTIVKRVAYLPGDWIEYRYFAGEWVYFNDNKVVHKIKHPERFPQRMVRVPEGYVFVLRDNPAVSIDSRQLGVLHVSAVQAKLVDPKPEAKGPTDMSNLN
jgi:signal peptidase I